MKSKERPTVAQFIARKIQESGKSQKEIAEACGWPKPNFVTMLKKGDSKLPIDKIGPLSEVLEVEPVYLFWLTMQEYMPDTLAAIEVAIRGVMLTRHERDIIETYRDLTHGIDEDVEIRVSGDEGHAKRGGVQILYRRVPGKPNKVSLATGAGFDEPRQAIPG